MKGALIINLGSPDSPSKKDVKKYLDEFLMDKFVIDLPLPIRTILVRGIILNTRPKKSAEAYQKVWTNNGSPLIHNSYQLCAKIRKQCSIPIEVGMRYGNPSIHSAMEKLVAQGVKKIFVMPMYPQFAMSSTETVIDKTKRVCAEHFQNVELDFLPPFYDREDYIATLGNSIQKQLDDAEYDILLFSYHGIPERHIYKSDTTQSHCKIDQKCCNTPSPAHAHCYRHQCFSTTNRVAKYLGLPEDTFENAFQSRLGKNPWLKPYTAQRLTELPNEGRKKLAVVTPAFVTDCLETIEEIDMEGREEFLQHGGEKFTKVDCLNDSEEWAKTLASWIKQWKGDN